MKLVTKRGKISYDNRPQAVQIVLLPNAANIGQKLWGSVDFDLAIFRIILSGDRYINTDDKVADARSINIGK